MRKPVMTVMTGLTAVVVALGIRAGTAGGHAGGSSAVGVVAAAPSAGASAAATAATKVNGSSVDTRYGPVQVQITVRSHRIVKARAIDYPQGSGTDQQINGYAIPQLDDEALQAQSAQIDTVSGATYTSQGYVDSLQSAIDHASAAGLL